MAAGGGAFDNVSVCWEGGDLLYFGLRIDRAAPQALLRRLIEERLREALPVQQFEFWNSVTGQVSLDEQAEVQGGVIYDGGGAAAGGGVLYDGCTRWTVRLCPVRSVQAGPGGVLSKASSAELAKQYVGPMPSLTSLDDRRRSSCSSGGAAAAAAAAPWSLGPHPSNADHFDVSEAQRDMLGACLLQVRSVLFTDAHAAADPRIVPGSLILQRLRYGTTELIQHWKATMQTTATLTNRGVQVPSDRCFVTMHGHGKNRRLRVVAKKEDHSAAPFSHDHANARVVFTIKQSRVGSGVQTALAAGEGKAEVEVEAGQLLITSTTVQPPTGQPFSVIWSANNLANKMQQPGGVSPEDLAKFEAAVNDEHADKDFSVDILLAPYQRHPAVPEAGNLFMMPLPEFLDAPTRARINESKDVRDVCLCVADRMCKTSARTGLFQPPKIVEEDRMKILEGKHSAIVRLAVWDKAAAEIAEVGTGTLVKVVGEPRPLIVTAGM